MSKPSVLAIGFSHMVAPMIAFKNRLKNGKEQQIEIEFLMVRPNERHKPFCSVENREIVYNGQLTYDIMEFTKKKSVTLVAAFFWANQNFAISAINNPRPFKFFFPNESLNDTNDDATELIPFDLMYSFIRQHCANTYGLVSLVKKHCDAPLFLFSAPPPIADLASIEGGCPEAMADQFKKLGVAPSSLRYKTWKLCEYVYNEYCQRDTIRFVPIPAPAVDEAGFLRREYASRDWIHAAPSYGELVLQQIEHILSEETGNEHAPLSAST